MKEEINKHVVLYCDNTSAMKKIKDFCEAQGIDFSALEAEWTNIGKDE